jgi:hypothetical protein
MQDKRINAGYEIIRSFPVGDTEFVLGRNVYAPSQFVTWECSNGNNYFWGHYCPNKYDALKDLCERVAQEVDYLASIGAIPPLSSRKPRDLER